MVQVVAQCIRVRIWWRMMKQLLFRRRCVCGAWLMGEWIRHEPLPARTNAAQMSLFILQMKLLARKSLLGAPSWGDYMKSYTCCFRGEYLVARCGGRNKYLEVTLAPSHHNLSPFPRVNPCRDYHRRHHQGNWMSWSYSYGFSVIWTTRFSCRCQARKERATGNMGLSP